MPQMSEETSYRCGIWWPSQVGVGDPLPAWREGAVECTAINTVAECHPFDAHSKCKRRVRLCKVCGGEYITNEHQASAPIRSSRHIYAASDQNHPTLFNRQEYIEANGCVSQ